MKKINQYLVAHYPLLWNTRVVGVFIANGLLHLLFFIAGFAALDQQDFPEHYAIWSVGGGTLLSFSILCSLLVLIVWLVFFLRNNAFKSFYPISRWYLAKEFGIILAIIFTSATFFVSYLSGVRTKVGTVTPVSTFVKEVNTINLAKAFIPTYQADYFILNNCANKTRTGIHFNDVNFGDTVYMLPGDTNQLRVREALREPGAFSYRHYCTRMLDRYNDAGIKENTDLNARVQQLLDKKDPAAVNKLLQEFEAVCHKYGIAFDLHRDSLATAVFASGDGPRVMVATAEFSEDRVSRNVIRNERYLRMAEIEQLYNFLYDCLPNAESHEERSRMLLVCAQVSMAFSILLLCYRRFSKKVFLVSVVGSIVWAIAVGLFVTMNRNAGNVFPVTCITLCIGFLIFAGALLRNKGSRMLTGVLLNWHIYLLPYLAFFVLMITNHSYRVRKMQTGSGYAEIADSIMKERYPVLYWVEHHFLLITWIYLLLAIVYTALLFNRWTRRWQVLPQE